jgi:hypothetical protein
MFRGVILEEHGIKFHPLLYWVLFSLSITGFNWLIKPVNPRLNLGKK